MATRTLRFERTMSEQEALMWALEQDPVLRSTFSNITVFDAPVDPVRFKARMQRAIRVIPRLAQRVVEPPGGVGLPTWADDTAFDLDFHVRRIALPEPADLRTLLDLAAAINSDPFDRARPLWQFTLIEGLPDGGGAMVQKMHHTITDGEGGVRMSTQFVDLERDAEDPLGGPFEEPVEMEPPHPLAESVRDTVRDSVAGSLRLPLDLARQALVGTIDSIAHPSHVQARASDALDASRSVVRQLGVTEPARSPLWTERSLSRRLEVLSIPLDATIKAAKAEGASVNDVFVAGAVLAAGAYHRAKGMPVDALRVAMPVSTRTDKGDGTNAFTPTRMVVPSDITDPVAMVHAVREVVAATRSERSVSMSGRLAGVLGTLPTTVLVRVARQQVGTVDFTTSNVRGAPFDLYIGGAKITANYPVGPLAGTAFNLTTLSSAGRLDMGCIIDTAAVDDPALLLSSLHQAYDQLLN